MQIAEWHQKLLEIFDVLSTLLRSSMAARLAPVLSRIWATLERDWVMWL